MKLLFTFLLCVLCFACKDDTTDPPKPATIQLAVEDASCTEAWLKVSLADANEPRTVAIKRDGQTVLTARLTANDTTLVDTSLLPKRSYTYQAARLNNNSPVDTSPTLQVTTMDTTSHSFQFSIDTLGVTSSVLYDVAIINDTLAYAVGEMYLRDSTGQIDPLPYNLAVWNGSRWAIRRLNYRGSPPVIRFVFAISERDIWFDPWFHWNGQQFVEVPIDPVFIGVRWNKMLGNSRGELYVVGDNGSIAYSSNNGSSWQRVESGTTVNFRDIWGSTNTRSGEQTILALASDWDIPQRKALRRIQGMTSSVISDSGLPLSLSGIWFSAGQRYYIVGDGVFTLNQFGRPWRNDASHPPIYKNAIRGNGVNDVIIAGSFGLLSHFNGVTWKQYAGVEVPMFYGLYHAVSMKTNFVIAVGLTNDKAIVLRGKRS